MKRSYRNPLLKELLADESLAAVRHRSLEQGVTAASRRRQLGNWARGSLLAASLSLTLWLLIPARQNPSARDQVARGPVANNEAPMAAVAPSAKSPAPVRFISDDELLALFPGRPLALIGPPGRMTLVFLEPSSPSDPSAEGSNH